MTRMKFPQKILVYEAVGFLAILVYTYLDTIHDFPSRYLIAHTHHPKVWHASVEAIGILFIAITTLMMTHQLLSRLLYLQSFLMVCSGCKKINHEGKWSPMIDFFKSGFDTKTTHGMCPECSKRTMQAFPI